VADQSGSVPLTLNDLELAWDARGQIFQAALLNVTRAVRLKTTKFGK